MSWGIKFRFLNIIILTTHAVPCVTKGRVGEERRDASTFPRMPTYSATTAARA